MNRSLFSWFRLFTFLVLLPFVCRAADDRGVQFIPFKSLSGFKKTKSERPNETILTSPEIRASTSWNELIASWNATMPSNSYLRVEVRGFYSNRVTKWFTMGLWSDDSAAHARASVRRQRDEDGDVDADTLVLQQLAQRVQVRLALGGNGREMPKVKFLSLSLLDNTAKPEPLPPYKAAWGKLVDVPQRSQMAYENGSVLCSPTTVSMLLSHWSHELKQPALDHDVPDVVKGVYDEAHRNTGNWSFNTAYAGSFNGMRGYAARLTDVSELEQWIAKGIPVGLSVCYNRLRGKSRVPSGHLVVLVGFTESGDPIINDPGTSRNVRKTFTRANLIDAWANSKNAAYFIYPENVREPKDRFCHWDSPESKRKSLPASKRLPPPYPGRRPIF